MKSIAISTVTLLVGVGVGWYFGYSQNRRELLMKYESLQIEVDSNTAAMWARNEARDKKAFETVNPWVTLTSKTALAALKDVDANNMHDTRVRLATLVATYYHFHSRDGDTNLLQQIVSYAATNSAVSNAIYGWPFSQDSQ
jgi:hypothetical protein